MVKRVIILLLAIVVGVIGGGMVNQRRGFGQVEVHIDDGLTVAVYPDSGGNNSYNYDPHQTPLFTLRAAEQTIKLKHGIYDFVLIGSVSQYENPVTKLVVNSSREGISISPTYTYGKLNNLLSDERSQIQQALYNAYPDLGGSYIVGGDQLFDKGEWYGAALQPIDPSNDRLHIIMKRSGDQWVVAAAPQINIAIPAYPNIPDNIIDTVDLL